MTPELKFLSVAMPFEGEYTQEQYTLQLRDEYKKSGVPLRSVYSLSFKLEDILY